MSAVLTPEEVEVARLLALAEATTALCEPKDSARTYVAIATLVSRNAGLDKRHTQHVAVEGVDAWVAGLGKPEP